MRRYKQDRAGAGGKESASSWARVYADAALHCPRPPNSKNIPLLVPGLAEVAFRALFLFRKKHVFMIPPTARPARVSSGLGSGCNAAFSFSLSFSESNGPSFPGL